MAFKCKLLGAVAAGLALVGGGIDARAQNWSGVYFGGHAGFARNSVDWNQISLTAEPVSFSEKGFIGGGHVGAQYQFGSLVAGLELGYTAINMNKSVTSAANPAVSYATNVDSALTAVGRLGFAFNNWMLYGRGGFAWADVDHRGVAGAPINDSFGFSDKRRGTVFGAGVEYAMTQNLILGLEYNRMRFDGGSFAGTTALAIPFTLDRNDLTSESVMARISYKFGMDRPRAVPLK